VRRAVLSLIAVAREGADALLAEIAAQVPEATTDEFRRQALHDCLGAAAERK